jgi:hypothetical protein
LTSLDLDVIIIALGISTPAEQDRLKNEGADQMGKRADQRARRGRHGNCHRGADSGTSHVIYTL